MVLNCFGVGMAMTPRKKAEPDKIKDEPGAEERFKGILKRALNTPPPRKRGAAPKGKPAKKAEGKL
jgi:hypothetical protein